MIPREIRGSIAGKILKIFRRIPERNLERTPRGVFESVAVAVLERILCRFFPEVHIKNFQEDPFWDLSRNFCSYFCKFLQKLLLGNPPGINSSDSS